MLGLIKNFKGLFGQSAMVKGEWKILRQCSYYRCPEDTGIVGTEPCTLEDQKEWMGEIYSR